MPASERGDQRPQPGQCGSRREEWEGQAKRVQRRQERSRSHVLARRAQGQDCAEHGADARAGQYGRSSQNTTAM